ncbi:hypothetical protein SDC9_137112 [bioreactor metagenome]|uniref:Uncharacterized protein n=1 Tax=bioreactor metagenome TaxID=1076179 RepID=A0A645DL03_9ZZZZ
MDKKADDDLADDDVGRGGRAGAQPVPGSPGMLAEEQGGDLLDRQERTQHGEPGNGLLRPGCVRVARQDQLCLRAGNQHSNEDQWQDGHDDRRRRIAQLQLPTGTRDRIATQQRHRRPLRPRADVRP